MKRIFLTLSLSACASWALAGADVRTPCEPDTGCAAEIVQGSWEDETGRRASSDPTAKLAPVLPVRLAAAPSEVMGFLDPDTIDMIQP